MDPYGALWINQTLWSPMEHMEPYGAQWIPLEPYGALWINQTLWSPMEHMEPYGTLWVPMDPYRALWIPMEPYAFQSIKGLVCAKMSGALPLQKAAFKRISRRKRAYLREAVLNKKKQKFYVHPRAQRGLFALSCL